MPPMLSSSRNAALALLVVLATAGIARAQDVAAARGAGTLVVEALPIEPEAAAAHVGKWCVVTMKVEGSRLMADVGRCYLNSRKDHRDKDNFTAVIFRQGLEKFAKADVPDPAAHFLGKTVRVTGTVELYKEKPQIKVELVDQIEVVEEGAGSKPGGSREPARQE